MSKEKSKTSTRELVLTIACATVIIVLIGALMLCAFSQIGDDIRSTVNTANVLSASYEAEKTVRAGTIVDKRTENGYTVKSGGGGVAYSPSSGNVGYVVGASGNKTYVPMRYIITVNFTYEYDGTVYEGTKDFEVEKEVYLAYEVGEWFDSQNFRYTEEGQHDGQNEEVQVVQ